MKRGLCISAFILIMAFLSGCGSREDAEAGGRYDVITETGQMPALGEDVDASGLIGYECLGSQFYQGERIQLWGEGKMSGGGTYLHREDGSRELLMEKVHNYFLNSFRWWLDENGRCYLLSGKEICRPDMDEVLWTDSDFKTWEGIVFRSEMEDDEVLSGICQLEADAYFSGTKSIDEVRDIVENRVRLYLNERR